MKILALGLLGALFAAATAQAQDLVFAQPPARTPSDVTLPTSVLDCRLVNAGGNELLFKLEVSGGRGYESEGRVGRTGIEVKVTSDPANLFEGYLLGTFDGSDITGYREDGEGYFGKAFVADVRQADKTLTDSFSGRVLMSIGEHRPPDHGMRPYFTATGFCDAVRTSQEPLSPSELAELISK